MMCIFMPRKKSFSRGQVCTLRTRHVQLDAGGVDIVAVVEGEIVINDVKGLFMARRHVATKACPVLSTSLCRRCH